MHEAYLNEDWSVGATSPRAASAATLAYLFLHLLVLEEATSD
jgi:hypothetical protein